MSGWRDVTISMNIDFPAPLGPTTATCSPSRRVKLTGSAMFHAGLRVMPFTIFITFFIYILRAHTGGRPYIILYRAHTEFFLRFAMKAAKPSDAPTN